ncbi:MULTISPECIES: SpoIIE family protein phosphatase [unclassified Actinotalea]|uniref:SpoIIE family protein phosphatase n=1 Tax=unclassified Actinotalea TaxID=2638618 RepID=UPI002105FAF1|nr:MULTISPECIES: SpoIIE family protein phosphatase [unclassified Actinotalea]
MLVNDDEAADATVDAALVDLAATRIRSDLAVVAAGIGTFDWDLATGELAWDAQLREVFGVGDGGFDGTIEGFHRRVHPDDLARVTGALAEAVERCGEYAAEYRVVRPNGDLRWVQARGRALAGPSGAAARVIGAAYDSTGRRQGEARVGRVLESMSTAFFSLDRGFRFTYVNAEAERVLGAPRDRLLGGVLWELFPHAVGSAFEERYRGAMASGVPTSFEEFYPAPLDRWYDVRAWPDPDGLSVYFHDITARRETEERLRQAMARSALLADVASELASTLDPVEAVGRLARVVVPTLAQWCIVTLVDREASGPAWRRLRDVGSWHEDPEQRASVERYAALRLGTIDASSPVARALESAHPVVVRGDATEKITALLGSAEAREALARLAPTDVVVLPLVAKGRVLGLLSLYDVTGRRAGDASSLEEDLRTATDVAARAGLALDSARLYAQQRRVAEGLQRSLLTEPPQVDGLQIAVRYQPAARAARVGGDWYDAFRVRPGVLGLVIGDVVGHDIEAAAAMGQARSLLRGIAATTGGGPADLLSRLDTAFRTLELDLMATALVAEVEDHGATPDGVVLRWSSAGHPTPLVVLPGGEVRELGAADGVRPDLLLGVDPLRTRSQHVAVLPPGSTLLLFTDGLVERRGERYGVGLARLVTVLRETAADDLEAVCDAVLDRVLPEQPGDDVALAAVRLGS